MASGKRPSLAAAFLFEEEFGGGGETFEDRLGTSEWTAGAEGDGRGFGDCDGDGTFRDGGGTRTESGECLDDDDDGLGDDGGGVVVMVVFLGRGGRGRGN